MTLKKIRIFINGFGRIGRSATRIILKEDSLELVGINDLCSYEQIAYLLKYDSIYGTLSDEIQLKKQTLLINGKNIALFNQKNPENLSIQALNVDVVLQCSGMSLTTKSNYPFIKNGAKKVIISAPVSDDTPTYIFGVNHDVYQGEAIISSSSCSANAIVPILKIIDESFGIESAMMSMYHSYTNYQKLLDGAHYSKDIRRTRSATQNIIPLMSSAAEATALFFPHLEKKLYAKSIRVPIPSTTLYDLNIKLYEEYTKENINREIVSKINSSYSDILDTTLVLNDSTNYIQNPYSAVVNLPLTMLSGNLLRISAWQDNEYGYSRRLIDLTKSIA